MARGPDRYPIGRLFAVATARLEDALAVAIAGQDPRLTLTQQRALQRRLVQTIRKCAESAAGIETATER